MTITKIVELEDAVPPARAGISGLEPTDLADLPWLVPDFLTPDGLMRMSIHSFLVETPQTRIVVDTGLGNDKPRAVPHWSGLRTGFLDDLRAAGWPPGSVQRVIHTHLHIDHVGWNTVLVDGAWVPTFPQARHLMVRADLEHWQAQAARTDDDRPGWLRAMTDVAAVWTDSVAPVLDAGQVDLVEPDARVDSSVRLLPTHGHTPGHASVLIESGGESAVITGDLVHFPCQIARPRWTSMLDCDQAEGTAAREKFLEAFADTGTLVLGTHFPDPTGGHIVRDGAAYRFEI
ncbi:MAG: MBL fold metallo-hydrolase [Pseudonocardia sp.]|nr:MBL fold metallo-hydrolase [Pseudonocardia sp.]